MLTMMEMVICLIIAFHNQHTGGQLVNGFCFLYPLQVEWSLHRQDKTSTHYDIVQGPASCGGIPLLHILIKKIKYRRRSRISSVLSSELSCVMIHSVCCNIMEENNKYVCVLGEEGDEWVA